ncbi:MAG: hypothetical protein ABIP08_10850 [Lautropia sp.]
MATSAKSPARSVGLSLLASAVILGAAWLYPADRKPSGVEVATYTPASAGEVVEQLQRQSLASKRELQERLRSGSAQPQSVDVAVAIARRHYDRARRDGEPRELGLAQSALGRWWDQPDAPVPVLQMRAAIRQYQHDFDGALADLGQAIAMQPANAQAWLSQAAILQTVGRLDDAAHSCRKVVTISDHVAGHVCLADLASLRGEAGAFDQVQRLLTVRRVAAAEGGWIQTVQAEMAERLGRDDDAERLFKVVVAATDVDSYAKVAYADFLLRKGRAEEVEPLLRGVPATDAVLLRRAIAMKRTSNPGAKAAIAQLRERFESSVSRDDSLHLREMARFALEIDGDAGAALRLAARNWALQKEPADALLLAQAARAAGRPQAAAPVRAFARSPGLSDVRLDALL